ncbi:MAG TPA: DedA family protein, partial [Nitrososphaera sp.]|nr:DedA family protein [Nitrososphaera sp.]
MLLEILGPIVGAITSFIGSAGYAGIFGLMLLESALIPIPSEIIMTFSGFLVAKGELGIVGVVLAGSLGNLAGSVLTYYLGLKVGRAFVLKYGRYVLLKKHHLELTEQWFEKYGDRTSFAGRLLPAIRTYVSLPAGLGRTDFKKFVTYTFAGSLIWNSVLTYAGVQLGSNWENIDHYSIYLDVAAAAAIAA